MLGTTNGDVLGGFGTSSSYRKGSKKWQNASKLVSVILIIAGMALAFIALVAGNGGSKWSGLLLGGLLVLAGISGVLGASKRSANFLNISVVVCIIGLLLAFQFVGEVYSIAFLPGLEYPGISYWKWTPQAWLCDSADAFSQICLQHAHVMLMSPCRHWISQAKKGIVLLCFKTLNLERDPEQVGRETEVDCALAELYVRSLATERLVKDTAHSEIFNSIFTRMNEMEDMMDLVQTGAVQAIDLKKKQEELRSTDQQYIQAKLAQLHRHAEVMLDSVLNNPNITADTVKAMAQEERDALQNRLDLADQALAKIKAKHAEENFTLTLPEYEQILEALMGSHHQNVPSHYSVSNHDELGQILLAAKQELPNMQGALERTHDNQYHLYNVDGYANTITEGAKLRAEKQKAWEQRFAELLQRRESSHSDTSWLQSMPQHCVQESRAKGFLVSSGLACAGVQVAAVYITLSLLLRIPIKGD